jgi:hypothetical protein
MIRWLLLTSALLVTLHSPAQAQDDASDLERRVKAAFLYKFAGYVAWPDTCFPDPATPVRIAVLGDEKLQAELTTMVLGHTVNGRPVVVSVYSEEDSLTGVHVLYVARREAARIPKLRDEARKRSVLLVSEGDDAIDQGSVIAFVLSRRRVRFDISVAGARRSGLTLSSRLLSVARTVVTAGS